MLSEKLRFLDGLVARARSCTSISQERVSVEVVCSQMQAGANLADWL
jgi:hypothetical protein